MMTKSRAGLLTLLQIYIVKMRIFNNIFAIQGSSVGSTFHLQTKSRQGINKKEATVTLI